MESCSRNAQSGGPICHERPGLQGGPRTSRQASQHWGMDSRRIVKREKEGGVGRGYTVE